MQDSKRYLAEKVFEAGNVRSDLTDWLLFSKTTLRRKYADVSDDEFARIWSELGESWYIEAMINTYEHVFTSDELKEILSFWVKPTGRKLVSGSFPAQVRKLNAHWAQSIESQLTQARTPHGTSTDETPKPDSQTSRPPSVGDDGV